MQFKNILESYDGLGIIRTVNKQTGEIVIITHLESESTIKELIASVAVELNIRFTEKIPENPEDWLLLSLKSTGEYSNKSNEQ